MHQWLGSIEVNIAYDRGNDSTNADDEHGRGRQARNLIDGRGCEIVARNVKLSTSSSEMGAASTASNNPRSWAYVDNSGRCPANHWTRYEL